jgi:hypothetical protein
MMKGKGILVGICVFGLLLALTLAPGLAQEPEERAQTQGTMAIEAVVSSKFSYQGVLNEDGTPVTGTRDMVFHLFSDDTCATAVGGDISRPGVEVNEGVFSVELNVVQDLFNGQGLWLGIQVEGTTVGCQEIMPVPYALSLRPGARIEGPQDMFDGLHVVNTADTGDSYGVWAQSRSPLGRGVYGYASADSGLAYGVFGQSNSTSGTGVFGRVGSSSGQNYGVWGQSNSTSGAGVYARGRDAGADLILAGNADTTSGDDGKIYSDPGYTSSDIYLIANDNIRIDLNNDAAGDSDSDFEIYNGDNTLIFGVDESGAVTFGGSGIAAFPRPAYDSGWVTLGQGGEADRTHNIGGNVDNYVVDLTCKTAGGSGINNWGVGGDANDPDYYGGWWSRLTTTGIRLHRWDDDLDCPQLRVRIWAYP